MVGSVQQGTRAFVTVYRAGDCDGAAVAALLTEAGQCLRALGPVWVRDISLDVDHHPSSAELALTVSYDHCSHVPPAPETPSPRR